MNIFREVSNLMYRVMTFCRKEILCKCKGDIKKFIVTGLSDSDMNVKANTRKLVEIVYNYGYSPPNYQFKKW